MKRITIANSKGGTGKSTLALSLADVLENAQLVDLDPQGTLTHASSFTGRHQPVQPEHATAAYLIYDTPPYNSTSHGDLFKLSDCILLPVKASIPDLLATTAIITQLKEHHLLKKTWLIINEVRKPHNNTYKEGKALLQENFSLVNIAQTELSNLNAFRKVFSEPLHGKAKQEVCTLVSELQLF